MEIQTIEISKINPSKYNPRKDLQPGDSEYEKLDRRCYMMEIDPHYIDVILNRWAAYTGEDPIREDGVKWSDLNG